MLESTTYPGTTRELVTPVLEAASGLRGCDDFLVGYSPERIDPGNSDFTLLNTPKIVAAIGAPALAAVRAFYGTFVDTLVPLERPEEAELAKLVENTFRHVNIALVNELAHFANELGVDLRKAIDAAATKPFGFMPFRPGPGVGGHCLPIDPSYLSWRVAREVGAPFRFVELANELNRGMPSYVVRRVQDQLNRDGIALRDARVLILGLAYKPGTGDTREAPAYPIIASLRRLGAEVRAVDPHVDLSVTTIDAAHRAWTAMPSVRPTFVLLLTEHDEFDFSIRCTHLASRVRYPRVYSCWGQRRAALTQARVQMLLRQLDTAQAVCFAPSRPIRSFALLRQMPTGRATAEGLRESEAGWHSIALRPGT